jgi:LPS-assembly lipoprotein|tara:strand:- start:945 stop:1433 length:489 start_codon:yes stop_codon:yes gene_type:complete
LFKKIRIAIIILATAGVAACGFHLQGAFTAPAGMERTYIASDNHYSAFFRELESRLRAAGVVLSDSPIDATATFDISFDQTAQRVLSVSTRNVPTEYEVFYTITYSLYSGSHVLLPPQTLTLTRDYTYDSTLVLGKAREGELLRDAIVQDLVRVVLKQISTL